jgi:hypothetical protein
MLRKKRRARDIRHGGFKAALEIEAPSLALAKATALTVG